MANKYSEEEIANLNIPEIKEILKINKIKGYSGLNKKELIEFALDKLEEAGLLIPEKGNNKKKKSKAKKKVQKYYETCNNQIEIISQEEVKDIPKQKFIQISNGNCYDVDNLVSLISSTEELNEDPIIKAEKGISVEIWKNEAEKMSILFHPGLDPEILREYWNMKAKKDQKLKDEILNLNEDDYLFLDKIASVGFNLINDNSGSFSHDPTVFMRSQEVLDGFLSSLNKHPKKDIFQSATFYNNNLKKVISSIKDTCIHGIGTSFIKLYLSFYYYIKYILKKEIVLSPYLYESNKNNYIVPQIMGNVIPEYEQSYSNEFDSFLFSVFDDRISHERLNKMLRINGISGLSNIYLPNTKSKQISLFIRFNDRYYSSLKEKF